MDMKTILKDYFQKFDPENIYREHARKYEILMKMKNRMRKIEKILSNLK